MHEGLMGVKERNGVPKLVRKIDDVAAVYEIRKDGTFRDIFKGSGFRDSWVNNEKVLEFCSKYPKVLASDGYAAFFRVGCDVVAVLKNKAGTISLNNFSFDSIQKWDLAKHPRIIVVPLGENKEEQLELFNQ